MHNLENTSLLIGKEPKMYRQESPDMKDRKKVILHLGIHSDAIVITRNTNDNETDSDQEDISTNIVKKTVMENPSFNQKMTSFNHKTCNTGLTSDIHNDTVAITQNINDSETDSDHEVSTNIVKKSTTDNPSYNQKTACFNRETCTTRLSSDPAQPKHNLLPVCRCKRRCSRKFSESMTRKVYESFCQQEDSVERKKWIMKHVEILDVKQWSRKKKQETRSYFLTDSRGRRIRVCSGYFQSVLGLSNGCLLEPLIGNMDHHQHHHVASCLENAAVITPEQTDSQSFVVFPGNIERDVNDDGFCNMGQSQDGSAMDINISSFSKRCRNVDACQCVHVDDSSDRDCKKCVTKDSIMKLRNNDDSVNRIYKSNITKDSIIEHNKGVNIKGCNKGIRKDSVVEHLNIDDSRGKHRNIDNTSVGVGICVCCSKDLNQDLHLSGCKGRGGHRSCTSGVVRKAGSSNRSERNIRNKERKVRGVHIFSAGGRNQNRANGNVGLNSRDSNDKSRRRSVGKDGISIDAEDGGCSRCGQSKVGSGGDVNIAGARTRDRTECMHKDRTVRSVNISCVSSTNKDSTPSNINISDFRNRRRRKGTIVDGTISDENISCCGNKNEREDRLTRDVNTDECSNRCCGTGMNKENSNVWQYIQQHYVQLDKTNLGTRSRERAVEKLHHGYLSSYPASGFSYEQFHKMCDQVHSFESVCKGTLDGSKAGMLRQVSESTSITRRIRSVSVGGETHESEMPERRRRSTRITRMQGSMAEEDNLLQIGVEASDGFDSGSACEDLHASKKNGLGYSQVKLKLCSKSRLPAKQNFNQSEMLMRSQFVISSQHNDSFHSDKQEMNEQPKQLNQSALKSKHFPRSIDGGSAGRNSTSRHMVKKNIRKKTVREKNNVKLKNYNRRHNETKQDSKKVCKLSTLKKKHKHPMLPPCNCSRRRCIENIPEDRRRNIHDQFWNLSSYKDRKRWLMKYVEKRERKNKVLSLFPQRKNESKRYFLPDDKNEVVEVCRLFFIHTLGFKWDSVVDAVVRTKMSTDNAGKLSRHQLKKLPRQLPDYVVESVTEYLTSVRNSCKVTGETHVDDGTRLSDDSHIDDWGNDIACRDNQTQHLPGLKVKDLFKNWKIKYKNLKFNLGYHSFRRIFQNIIDPVPICQEEVTEHNLHIHTSDLFPVACADVQYSSPPGLSNACPNITDHQDTASASFSEEEFDELKSGTNLKVLCRTESTKDSDLTISAKNQLETLILDGKSVCQGDECIDMKNCSRVHENLTNDHDNCVLDVGSGYFKPVDGATNNLCPYTSETKYTKRRSLSMRNDRSNYPVLPACKCRKRKCAEKFTESQRQDINTMFWDLGSYNERKQWILEHIKRADIKRRIVFSEGTPRKLESRWYYLPNSDGHKVDVCKCFFLRTLGYRWDSVIDTIGKTTPKGVKLAAPDKRGRKPPPHKISDEAIASMALYIENVCNTYQPVGHKRSQEKIKECKSNTRGQIPYGLTMKQLFEDYKSKHPNHKFGYESFRKVFRRVHGEYVASLSPDVESSEEPETAYSKMTVSDDKGNSVRKDYPVGEDCSVRKDYPVDEDLALNDYPVGKDCSVRVDYPVDQDSSLRKNYLVGKNCLVTNDYPVCKDFSERKNYPLEEDYSVDKDCSEATIEGCSNNLRPEDSHFALTAVSYSETNLHTPPQPLPAPPQPTHHEAAHQHQVGSNAVEQAACLYQSHNLSSDSRQCLPVMQIPGRVEPLTADHYSSAGSDPSLMYNHNLYFPPTGMSGHFAHTVDHLGHSSDVNPHTDIDSATYGAQGQTPAYFVSNPEPLRHQVYQMASQYQSILHHIAESNRFFSYGYPSADNTFQDSNEKHNLFTKQDFHRSNMNCHNIPKTSYSYVAEPASIQAHYPSQNQPMHHNTRQENTVTILSPYSDENDNSFAQDHQEISSATIGQDSVITSFNNGFSSRIEGRESASKIKTQTKNGKSEKKKVAKETKMKVKSLRNYGNHYPMLAPCNCKKKKCTDKFSEKARQKLHDMFWDLKDYNDRKQWMLLHIKREECKRRRIDQFESFRKLESRWYFFPDESGNQHEVCKDFFLRTLGYKWDSVIDTIRRTTPKGDTTTRPDQRGRKAPAHKLPGSVLRSVVQYIESMQQVSQPLNEHVKNVENLNCEKVHENITGRSGGQIAVPYGLTMKDLYDDYKAKHAGHKIGYESFRRIFRALSKSEKIIFDDKTSEDEFLSLNNQDLVDL